MLKCKALVKNRKKSDEARVISYAFQFEFEMFTFLSVSLGAQLGWGAVDISEDPPTWSR